MIGLSARAPGPGRGGCAHADPHPDDRAGVDPPIGSAARLAPAVPGRLRGPSGKVIHPGSVFLFFAEAATRWSRIRSRSSKAGPSARGVPGDGRLQLGDRMVGSGYSSPRCSACRTLTTRRVLHRLSRSRSSGSRMSGLSWRPGTGCAKWAGSSRKQLTVALHQGHLNLLEQGKVAEHGEPDRAIVQLLGAHGALRKREEDPMTAAGQGHQAFPPVLRKRALGRREDPAAGGPCSSRTSRFVDPDDQAQTGAACVVGVVDAHQLQLSRLAGDGEHLLPG